MRMIRSIGLCALAMVFATTTVIGQQSDTEQPDSEQPVSQEPAPEHASPKSASSETASPKRDAANDIAVSNGVVSWEPIDTHLQVTVSITGKDFAWQQTFDDHQFPTFDPSDHEDLKPGIYQYSLNYVSNEVVDQKSALDALRAERKGLLQQYEEAIEAGNADAVKRLYWQANDVRSKASAMSQKQMQMQQRKKDSEDDYIRKRGQIVIGKNGDISKFNREKSREAHRKKIQQEREENDSARKTENGQKD